MRGVTIKALWGGWLLLGVAMMASSLALAVDDWPRTFTNVDGSETTIPGPPRRILSTSVTITGTLLAIDAPLVASATSANGHFFDQWEGVAQERGVQRLWPAGSVDLETAYAVEPDLIVVSASGADSALAQVPSLQAIAPTIVLDYGGQTWQSLARQLGEASGLEDQVDAKLAEFDDYLAQSRYKISVPEGEANIISYNGPGAPNPIALSDGVHGQLLQALGFTIESPAREWQSDANSAQDFVRAQYEYLTQMRAPTTFLLSAGDERAAAFLDDPILANLPSVQAGQVYGLGANSFRIDFFSATEVIDGIVERFGANHDDDRRRSVQ
ncbi:Fe2+-enterobactin ABC transporter substrate-binding protein [Billgrantia endophytica]|uniref:Fe2+-enterobactin ABC transporter substrate-binding protein n=1 Tax=Billgrantia endophytica TaxID=2033802 RepID=A0A2N7TZI7_9GAMM|nr:Fe2+-enterobactin ABC transporter substrate-binding protein [Halomonas endophytica]PMR73604.1 Fe2+-enterobactin ABC transporter substrate-binding protein [Halomonas endophytica]